MNIKTRLTVAACVSAAMLLCPLTADAGVIIHGTRVIYPAERQEVIVRLENKGTRPALVQTWLDDGDRYSTAATAKAPLSASPPIFRIEPHQQQALRLRYSGEPLPADRESLFWLNVLEVPPSAAKGEDNNQIELAFRTRLRVLVRPQALPYPVASAASRLQWKLVAHERGYALQATNPTPYHVSLASVELLSAAKRFAKAPNQSANDSLLLPAGDVKRFALPLLRECPPAPTRVEFTSVSDFGARVRHSAALPACTGQPS
ncbi:fimbria/pilus periplasmic chaperone [Pseudomonas sp. MF7453]|uniref:fimbrial biogenesis chaperone n=1 Tax=Pseudomonas sp. MF7453 TaxID=2797539 RepID=UPI0018E8C2E3|nr:fimbria/pilus periplasmic chaperone [Pseudomonas sp. MF7453]